MSRNSNVQIWLLQPVTLQQRQLWWLQEVAQKVAMHAVAMKPQYLKPECVPAEALEGQSCNIQCCGYEQSQFC